MAGSRFAAPGPVSGSEAPGNRGWESIAASPRRRCRRCLAGSSRARCRSRQRRRDESRRAPARGVRSAAVGRRGAGAALQIVVRQAGRRLIAHARSRVASATAARRRSPRTPTARSTPRGVTCTRQHPRHRVHEVFGRRPHVRAAACAVSDDNWVLDGCPENGPALIVDGAKAHSHRVADTRSRRRRRRASPRWRSSTRRRTTAGASRRGSGSPQRASLAIPR